MRHAPEQLEIVNYPHPALRWKSKPVVEINAALRRCIEQMFELMYDAKGIGLAANQVALPLQMFIINPTGDPDQKDQECVFINPEIVRRKGSIEGEEGCLSLPELYGHVARSREIVVEAFDLDGQGFEMTLNELPSRVVQHETDHLHGVLFIDRLSEASRRDIEVELSNFEAHFEREQTSGRIPTTQQLEDRLRELEPQQP